MATAAPAAVWTPLQRDYEAEAANASTFKPVSTHPLAPAATPVSTPLEAPLAAQEQGRSTSPLDPLSPAPQQRQQQQQQQQVDNPLMADAAVRAPAVSPLVAAQQSSQSEASEPEFIPWSAVKATILHEYTTDQQIGITVSFLAAPAGGAGAGQERTAAAKLEELEQTAEVEQRQTLSLTQKEYIKHIDGMHADMHAAWEGEDRVKTLKIAIQCAKMLSDTSVPAFYPSKFVLVSEILDTFGNLVYDRIKQRRTVLHPASGKPLPECDIPQQVRDLATETCRNWFYKIASIRELMPRLITEMAILRCYQFIAPPGAQPPFADIVARLSQQVRGIADPLVNVYVQAYLVRKARDVLPLEKGYLLALLSDTLEEHKLAGPEKLAAVQSALGLSPYDHMRLFGPALDWLMHCLSYKADAATLASALDLYRASSRNARVLNHMVSSLPPSFVAANAQLITQLIRESDAAVFPQHQLYRTLGVNLTLSAPPPGSELVILNDVWKVVTKFEDPEQYMCVAEVFIEYTLKHCSAREVNILLGDMVGHVSKCADAPKIQGMLLSSVEKILVEYGEDFPKIFALDKFIKVVDLFAGQSAVALAKSLLEALARNRSGTTTDPVIISTLFNVSTTLHDTVNALSLQDEVRQISRLISNFVSQIDYGKDVEKQLNFYVECRQCFANLDSVKQQLVHCVANLAMRTLILIKGKHNRKTAPFIRACIAFCYITIPTMDEVFPRLSLYLLSAEVALLNQSIPQADSLLRGAITLVQEVPTLCSQDRATEDQLAGFVAAFCSALLAAPGHPDHGALYLLQGLLKVLKDYPWIRGSTARGQIYLSVLALLAASAQQRFAYHYRGVDANDALYRGDADYAAQLARLVADVVAALDEAAAALRAEPDCATALARLAVDTLNVAAGMFKVTPQVATALYALASAARQQAASNAPLSAYLASTLAWLRKRPGSLERELANKLSA
eukprot:m51a1_g8233 hypothetical protein (963) ;mRNA; r:65433-69134